ncbi:MAG: class I SAM-dependent methyltransferase [Actinobacteria bacterium]|nr:class I SAM-dependent methyltransferase [Actinomycetota bacterium]
MDSNQLLYDRLVDFYSDLALLPAERAVLARLGPGLAETDMLDLGVGAGRTGYTFAPLVNRYVGLDYSPRMIERAKETIGDDPNVELIVGDARDLSTVRGPFGFVLFSLNGIDAAAPEERPRILAEIRRVLRPDGCLLLSSHSLNALPLTAARPRPARWRGSRIYRAYALVDDQRFRRRIARINREIDLADARRRGWTVVRGRGHPGIVECYVDPEFQVRQLSEAGFETIMTIGSDGRQVEMPYNGPDPWLDYLCRPAS